MDHLPQSIGLVIDRAWSDALNFSWLRPRLAGSAFPEPYDLDLLHGQGVRAILSLTPERPVHDPRFRWCRQPLDPREKVPDHNRTLHMIDFVCDALDEGLPVLVHCMYGKDRTGALLAMILMELEGITAGAAIDEVRTRRPDSIRFAAQESAVRHYGSW